MKVALKGWISDFFAFFEKVKDTVVNYVTQTIASFEQQISALVTAADTLWTYFSKADGSVYQLWMASRCDICQAGVLHIYQQGCAYVKKGICSIVDYAVCGAAKPVCDKVLCPIIDKFLLTPQCNSIMSRLDAALLDKQKGTYSPLDNFNTLAVCRKIGMCKQIDSPFDGSVFQAVVKQAGILTQNKAKGVDAAAAAATNPATVGPVPEKSDGIRISDNGKSVWIPGLQADFSIWMPNNGDLTRVNGIFHNIERAGPLGQAGVQETGWFLKKINGKGVGELGQYPTIGALFAPKPGETLDLTFLKDGFLFSDVEVLRVTFTEWGVEYASSTKVKAAAPTTPAAPATPAPTAGGH
jgi:hypothetical protein